MKKSNFSDFEPIFFLFGGVVTKNAFSKMFLTFRYAFFDTKLILSQHPQQVFYNFKNPFLKIFGKSIIFLIFWMFLHHPSKFGEFSLKIGGEIICQSWPLLTPFFNFRIVQWLVRSLLGCMYFSNEGNEIRWCDLWQYTLKFPFFLLQFL